MKKVRGKGTPHPRKTRALRDLTNQQIDKDPEGVRDQSFQEAKENDSSESPWVRLSSVHERVAAVCTKIDSMMLEAHRLGLSNRISNYEVDNIAVAMAEVESILMKWENLLSTAADRPAGTLQKGSSSRRGDLSMKDLIPMEPDSATKTMVLSNSPLVASSHPAPSPVFVTPVHSVPLSNPSSKAQLWKSTNHPISSQNTRASTAASSLTVHPLSASRQNEGGLPSSLLFTPVSSSHSRSVRFFRSRDPDTSALSPTHELDSLSRQSADSSSSQLPVTPALALSSRTSRLFRCTTESHDSTISTPPSMNVPYSPGNCPSPDLMTPLPPPELLLRYPFLGNPSEAATQEWSLSSTPSFVTASLSPNLSTPAISRRPLLPYTEFSTPENDRQEVATEGGSGTFDIVDDFTASTVKRLGEKGLEEELWFRLQLGSAAAHKFVRQRPLGTPSCQGSGKKNLNEYLNTQSSQSAIPFTKLW